MDLESYMNKRRWNSYWYQIQEVKNTNPEKVLEVGIGHGIVSDYLKKLGIEVTTFDINEEREPDVVGNVLNLTEHFENNSFDTILCAEVLEHLPFEKFTKALSELAAVTKESVVLSLPNFGLPIHFEFSVLKKDINLTTRLPSPIKYEGAQSHHWEINRKGYSKKRVLKEIRLFFKVKKEYTVPGSSYHQIFILKKTLRDEK